MSSPPIDPRTYDQIVAQTEALAQQLSGWQPQPADDLDAGGALIRIFGRYAEIIVDRLNQAPDKAFLAFLDLIGTQITPPQPARVPLTFQLAAGSPVDGLVPARTQVAAPPEEGEEDEVVFETEHDLLVTRSQLVQVVARDFAPLADRDRYGRYTANALGEIDEPFPAFAGNEPMVHALYLAADMLLNLEAAADVTVHFTGPEVERLRRLPMTWAYLQEESWQDVSPENVQPGAITNDIWPVTLRQIPKLAAGTVNGVKGGWLRLQLALPLPPPRPAIPPEAMATGAANPVPYAPPFYPFGADGRATLFYLNAEHGFARRGALVELDISLATAGAGSGLRLQWDYLRTTGGGNATWTPLEGVNDGTAALTQNGRVRFYVPADGGWGVGLYRNASGRWLRVTVTAGSYTRPPQIASMTISEQWRLPELSRIHLSLPGARPPLLADTGFTNSLTLDMSKDFYPFGETPRFNDAFYLAYGTVINTGGAQPGDLVVLNVTLGAAGVAGSSGVTLAWEFWNGRTWEQLGRSSNASDRVGQTSYDFRDITRALTVQPGSGGVQFKLPGTAVAHTVNGVEDHWLRARIVMGDYGAAASYEAYTINISGQNITAYRLVAASYKPPLITTLRFDVSNTTRFNLAACVSLNDFAYVDHTQANAAQTSFVPFTPTADHQPTLYLGFDRPFDNRSVSLYAQVEPPPPEAVIPAIFEAALEDQPPQVSWEYSSGQGWSRLGVIDETNAFDGRGLIRFVGPKGLAARHLFGQELYWLRVRWREGHFPVSPRLRRLLTNTTWARQAVTIRDEIVGSSDGNPGQRWPLAQQNILTGETIAIREPDMPPAEEIAPEQVTLVLDAAGDVTEIWVRWQEVADFHGSGPRDRHYVLDRITGTVLFGDGRHGMMPPTGQNNIRASYRSGGGERGNRAAGTIIQLKSSVAYVDSVTNVEAASGGAERQSLDSVRRYGPRALRHRYRAVTAVDLEDLAFAASAQVARAKAIPPRFSPLDLWLTPGEMPTDLAQHRDVREAGVMGLIIVPQSDSPRPVPSLELVEQVREYLVARSAATADVWVAGPEWIEVSVTAVIVPTSLEAADFVGEAVKTALARFLHPLTGGAEGKGWAFGRKPYRSDLFALIEGVAGVEYVRSLAVAESPDTATISRLERRLIFSGQHEIVISV
jgi:hypothetical protein